MEKAIHHILSNSAGVTALTSTRIFPVFADWAASVDMTTGKIRPTIVYARNDTVIEIDVNAAPKMQVGGFTIDYFAETFVEEMALGDAIYTALHGQSGTFNGVTVTTVKFAGRASLDDTENEGRFVFHGQQMYRVAMKL